MKTREILLTVGLVVGVYGPSELLRQAQAGPPRFEIIELPSSVLRLEAHQVSPNGEHIAGTAVINGQGKQFFIWSEALGWRFYPVASPVDVDQIWVRGVGNSGNGIAIGTYGLGIGYWWQPGLGFQELDDPYASNLQVKGISGDATTIFGFVGDPNRGGSFATHWTSPTAPPLELGGEPDPSCGHPNWLAFSISNDASITVGNMATDYGVNDCGSRAAKWTDTGGFTVDAAYAGYCAISGDGSHVTVFVDGTIRIGPLNGGLTDIGPRPDGGSHLGQVTNDGTIALFYRSTRGWTLEGGWIWTASTGIIGIKEYLQNAYCLDLSQWGINAQFGTPKFFALRVADDGSAIIGQGHNPAGQLKLWRVVFDGPDADGDGLYDDWETDGMDLNADGIIDLDLPAMGAKWDRKDLFLEIDRVRGAAYDQAAVNKVIQAFAAAPNSNPDGSTGITLHCMLDEDRLRPAGTWAGQGVAEFFEIKQGHYGTVAERTGGNWLAIECARKRAFRYCIYADELGDGRLGWAEQPGNDLCMSMGSVQGEFDPNTLIKYEAATFMHEFGHMLDLGHGGSDEDHWKPNYVSIMNYARTYPWEWLGTDLDGDGIADISDWKLEFSREELSPLYEGELFELHGLDSVYSIGRTIAFGYQDPGDPNVSLQGTAILSSAIDWNQNGSYELGQDAGDLNWLGDDFFMDEVKDATPNQTLTGCNDWDIVKLAIPFPLTGDYADAPPNPSGGTEMTLALANQINSAFTAPPPAACPADLDGDGLIGLSDLAILLSNFGTASGALAEDGDVNGDGAVDLADLAQLLALFGTPCG